MPTQGFKHNHYHRTCPPKPARRTFRVKSGQIVDEAEESCDFAITQSIRRIVTSQRHKQNVSVHRRSLQVENLSGHSFREKTMPFCTSCGAASTTDAKFCAGCGNSLVPRTQLSLQSGTQIATMPNLETPTSDLKDESQSSWKTLFGKAASAAGKYKTEKVLSRLLQLSKKYKRRRAGTLRRQASPMSHSIAHCLHESKHAAH